jgi:hypothetical protein
MAKKQTQSKKVAKKTARNQMQIGDMINCPDCSGTGKASNKYVTGAGPTLAEIGRPGLRCVLCNGSGKLEKVTETGSLQPYRKPIKVKMKLPKK